MKANRIVTFILSNLLVISAFAQIQQGYVKSLGRPDKKGVALSGVSVRVRGEHNVVLSQQDGTFSMLLTGKKNGDAYSLQQVQKSGYELNEKGALGRQYAFSDKVPLVIVMVSKEQLQADKRRIEDNAYQVAENKYKAKLAQLDKQKEKNAISIENYQAELQDLQDKFEKYQSLIEGLAEHYAHVDYDNLTEKEREINVCIENGDLERADLLIQKLFNPIDVVKRSKDALAIIEQQEMQARSMLAQANADMVAVMKQQDKDAEYLYQLYTIAAGQFDYEKARFYIETRAELDTTNVEWQHDAAYYYFNQKQYQKAEVYYKRALVLYQQFVESAPDTYEPYVAITLNSLGTILYENHWMAEAEKMYLSALETCRHLATSNLEVSESIVPIVQNNLANLYMDTQRYIEAEKMILEVLEANKRYAVSNPETYEPKVAMTQSNLANLYKDTQRFPEAEKMYLSALETLKRLALSDPKANEPNLAMVEESLGILYFMTQRYAEAEKLLLASLEINQRLAAANPEAFEPNLAATKNKLAIQYQGTLRYAEAEKEYLSALEIYQRHALAHPEAYMLNVAGTQEKLAFLYSETEQFDKAEKMYLSVLEILQRLAKDNPEVYEPRLAQTQNDLVILYHKTQRLAEAESMCLSALKTYQHLAASDPKTYELEVATAQNTLAVLYYITKRNAKAFHAFYEALVIYGRLAKNDQSQQDNYDKTFSVLKVLYSLFELSGEIPKECEADVEKFKRLLEES